MKLLGQINGVLLKAASWCVIATVAVIAVVIPYEVFGRYVLNSMSVWSGELSQYCLVWASMMGGAVGLKRGYQVGITTLLDKLPPQQAKWVRAAGYLSTLVFLAVMTYYGTAQTITNLGQVSPGIGLSMSIPYAALPLGFGIMFFVTLEQLLELPGLSAVRGK